MDRDGFDWSAAVAGAAAGLCLALLVCGVIQERARRVWNAELDREARLWEESCDRAYERGVCDGARLANPVEPAGMVKR